MLGGLPAILPLAAVGFSSMNGRPPRWRLSVWSFGDFTLAHLPS